ncbi:Formyltransferase/hydrolase complex Fhc subunit C [subsurface metagenome]
MKLKESVLIPLEADSIRPDLMLEKSRGEIEALPLYHGNRELSLSDLFEVRGEKSERIRITGDLSHVKRIGYGMTRGSIIVEGSVGMHLGAELRGGEIIVEGDASDWVGAEMKGGLIRIKGSSGHFTGASYPGSKRGMNRGMIIVEGNCGREAGGRMRRGLIAILGNAGHFLGSNLIAGTILVFGRVGESPGAGMRRGTIVLFQKDISAMELLPTFRRGCTCSPRFLRVYLRSLGDCGISLNDAYLGGRYSRYAGDFAELGKGEILIYEH